MITKNDSTPQIKKYMKNGESWVKTTRNVTAKYEPKPHTITEGIDMKSKKYQDAVKEAARISTAEQWEAIKEGIRREEREEIVRSFRDEVIGKDELHTGGFADANNDLIVNRNRLRAELRRKLDKLK